MQVVFGGAGPVLVERSGVAVGGAGRRVRPAGAGEPVGEVSSAALQERQTAICGEEAAERQPQRKGAVVVWGTGVVGEEAFEERPAGVGDPVGLPGTAARPWLTAQPCGGQVAREGSGRRWGCSGGAGLPPRPR
ncbi:MAG: hypothetical protein M5T61_06270 [Acidimicrobiia bacterium]|nr:hypothetical protein [Acidimicrobiia bacterium]